MLQIQVAAVVKYEKALYWTLKAGVNNYGRRGSVELRIRLDFSPYKELSLYEKRYTLNLRRQIPATTLPCQHQQFTAGTASRTGLAHRHAARVDELPPS